ncbi:LiaF transmembrane domain-containing protein [Rosettibacter firmus]|uniref:LiaF transmembrane domain-containing protein n=1 Tax=Rosettibacter firmus TaxID=3111522 RepID=UPI00336C1BC0
MHQSNLRYWLGIIFIVIGILLIIDNLGFFYFGFRHIIFSWHTILIIIGIILLIRAKNNTLGIILLVIGAYGLINHIFKPFFNFSFRDLFPLFIIIIGLYFILKRNEEKQKKEERRIYSESYSNIFNITDDFLDETCLLAHNKRKITSQNFKGGKITIIAGATEIDLTESNLYPGEAILEITCLVGGFTILVPKNWKVITNVTTIFGGMDSKQYFINNSLPSSEGLLIINGIILFGGGEIKSIL